MRTLGSHIHFLVAARGKRSLQFLFLIILRNHMFMPSDRSTHVCKVSMKLRGGCGQSSRLEIGRLLVRFPIRTDHMPSFLGQDANSPIIAPPSMCIFKL